MRAARALSLVRKSAAARPRRRCMIGRSRSGRRCEPPGRHLARQVSVRAKPGRLAVRNTADEALAIGLPSRWLGDIYHLALRTSWPRFLLSAVVLYIVINLFFGLLYLAQPDAITEARSGSFADAFFFSVQTIATVGY